MTHLLGQRPTYHTPNLQNMARRPVGSESTNWRGLCVRTDSRGHFAKQLTKPNETPMRERMLSDIWT